MWEMCAGLLGHVHFTLPLVNNSRGQYVPTSLLSDTSSYSPYTPSTTPNLTALENFMVQITKDAFEVSPFYRHYGMFHLASNSAGCGDYTRQTKTNPVPSGSKYTFSQDVENGHGTASSYFLSAGSGLETFTELSRKGILNGLLGEAPRYSCFCGFEFNAGQCVLPPIILAYIQTSLRNSTPDMRYLQDIIASAQRGRFFLEQNERVQRTLKILWQPGLWPCPELDPSDHWGIVKDKDAWTRSTEGSTINANDLFETGSAGPFRAGTVGNILSEARMKITPMDRIGTMNPSDGSPLTGHTKCEIHRANMRPESLAAHFVNDLFPAAQGIVDSPAVSHCMRFAMEMARVSVITILTGTDATRDTIVAGLSSTMRQWRQRCAAQIDLLGVCVMTKALDSRNGVYSTGDPSHCAFRLSPGNVYRTSLGYITPGCLVYVYGSQSQPTIHDPCQVYDCSVAGDPILLDITTNIVGESRTRLKFNPLDMVDPLEVRGIWDKTLSISSTLNQSTYDLFLQKVDEWHSDLTRDMPGRLTDMSLFRRALLNEERSGVGSPNTGDFGSFSCISHTHFHLTFHTPNTGAWNGPNTGVPLKTATERPGGDTVGNTRHCDMMVDWYPEHFEYPVAYHPTAPCSKADTAYRTFDRSFSYDYNTHAMYFEPLSMRDPDYVHTHFGAEGLCRTSNIGLDMQEVNTARVCTRVPLTGYTGDPSVPTVNAGTQPIVPLETIYSSEKCGDTSRDVPWYKGDDPMKRFGEPGWRATHSVGGIPFYIR